MAGATPRAGAVAGSGENFGTAEQKEWAGSGAAADQEEAGFYGIFRFGVIGLGQHSDRGRGSGSVKIARRVGERGSDLGRGMVLAWPCPCPSHCSNPRVLVLPSPPPCSCLALDVVPLTRNACDRARLLGLFRRVYQNSQSVKTRGVFGSACQNCQSCM